MARVVVKESGKEKGRIRKKRTQLCFGYTVPRIHNKLEDGKVKNRTRIEIAGCFKGVESGVCI